MKIFGNLVTLLLLTLVTISLSKVAQAENLYTGDQLYEYGDGIPADYRYFVQVMGGETLNAAIARYGCVRKAHPTLSVGVFAVPVTGGLKPRFPFTVAVASYVTKEEADEALKVTKQRFNYSAVAECLGVDDEQNAIDIFKQHTYVFELKVDRRYWQRSKVRSPVASYDGIGEIRSRSDNNIRHALVEGKPYSSASAVAAALASFHGRYPGIHLTAIQHGSIYFVSVTSIVGEVGLKSGIQAMREIGAYNLAVTASFQPVETNLITQNTVSLVDIEGTTLPPPLPTTQIGNTLSTNVLEPADLFETVPARVKRCYEGSDFKDASQLINLASCSGVVLTPSSLTRCLLESECHGLRVPIGFMIPEAELVRTCLGLPLSQKPTNDAEPVEWRDPITACQATTLDPAFLTIVDKSGLRSCFATGEASSAECLKAKNIINTICSDSENVKICENAGEVIDETAHRVDALLECLKEDRCSVIVPRPPAVKALVTREAERLGLEIDKSILLTKQALGSLGADASQVVSKFKECMVLKDAAKTNEAAICFIKLGLNQGELDVLSCINNANNDIAKTSCIAPAGTLQGDALMKAQCAYDAGTDVVKLAGCAGGDTLMVTEAFNCASASDSVSNAALNCFGVLPKGVTDSINCAKTMQSASEYLQCLPNLGGKEKAALCLANSKTEAERLGCVSANFSLDPNLASALGCISTSNGNSAAMATCAASPHLPPEVAKAANCAANSTGATDFALCAVGSGLNPELRIASECAVSTGGTPPAFAACTAGRLTARELGKCLTGEIGKEGGCFGPNNDLVKAFSTQINDVIHGPGENNDLRVALGKITEPLKSLGGEVSRGLQRIADDAKRGDIGRTICNWIGC